jgi:hypothetical protein
MYTNKICTCKRNIIKKYLQSNSLSTIKANMYIQHKYKKNEMVQGPCAHQGLHQPGTTTRLTIISTLGWSRLEQVTVNGL